MRVLISGIFVFIYVMLQVACSGAGYRGNNIDNLRSQLYEYVDTLDATVGIAVITSTGDSLTVNNDVKYPMMSVFKFHQALAVSDVMQKNRISFDSCIYVYPKDLELNTWSPMKKDYPHAHVWLPLKKLFEYMIVQSDNLACDILFDRFVSPNEVEDFIKSHGINEINIRHNEAQMYYNHSLSYENWTTPYAAAILLDKFIDGSIIDDPGMSYIKKFMLECTTGDNRLASAFHNSNYRLGHKTGSGYEKSGRVMCVNDIGFVVSNDGSKLYTIAVLVKDSGLSEIETERIIGTVSEMVFKTLSNQIKHPERINKFAL